jgi:hypothetical protein
MYTTIKSPVDKMVTILAMQMVVKMATMKASRTAKTMSAKNEKK